MTPKWMNRLKKLTVASTLLLTLVFFQNCGSSGTSSPAQGNTTTLPACVKAWSQNAGNPVITFGEDQGPVPDNQKMAYNDPSVMKEGSTYRMWLSGGTPTVHNKVRIYHATSTDGISWDINQTPLIEPDPNPGAWDDEKTETPNVVRTPDGMYHMYYSGCSSTTCPTANYSTGHATSSDGLTWLKDPANPIITPHNDPNHWGFYASAEPGVVFDTVSGKGYLYFTTIKARGAGYTGALAALQGIVVLTSANGTDFKHQDGSDYMKYTGGAYTAANGFDGDVVLTQSDFYPVTQNYIGYSTPFAFIDSNHVFHIFHDVAADQNGWRQVALAHATSNDGFNFTQTETNIFTNGGPYNQSWTYWETIGPAVMQDGDVFKMWFAGHKAQTVSGTEYADWTTQGIGYATFGANCSE